MLAAWQTQIHSTQIISGRLSLHHLSVSPQQQKSIAESMQAENGVLLTEWVAPVEENNTGLTAWYVLYLLPTQGLWCVRSLLNRRLPTLVDLSAYFPVANRLQRTIYELTRIPTRGLKDKRQWLNHGHFPLGVLNTQARAKLVQAHAYPFHKVSGNGVHEIPVGPVHAGIIEPGHFRFSVVGERILKLEDRLGYTHKGIHQLLLNKSIPEAAKLIGRVSGDSTVGYSYAFAMACENALAAEVNSETYFYRAILLERERLANHLGDIAAIINDAGLPSLQSCFTVLKEMLLRQNINYFPHRYFMDAIIPFATFKSWTAEQFTAMRHEMKTLTVQLNEFKRLCDQHYGLQDRIVGTGVIERDTARKLGLLGLAAKASGIDFDLRRLQPYAPYDQFTLTSSAQETGDVAARVAVRFQECFSSIELIENCIEKIQHVSSGASTIIKKEQGMGFACVEGWRGPIVIAVSIKNKQIELCHFHDPSWQNWPALAYAVLNNIVADFPLINKSFNLSYSGQDS